MADPILEFDPAAEGTGTALTITTGNYGLTSFSAPAPPPKLQWAGSVDTEGSALAARGHENRVITVGLEVTGATALADLQNKLAKMHREGGTLKYTSPASTAHTYDVLVQDGWDPVFDHLHYLGGVTSCQFSLTCKPYGRGAEQDLGDNTETTLPVLVFTEASIPGDVPALGRLVIDNDASVAWRWLTWGIQSRHYSSSANAALFYEAEGRTALGGSATAAGPSGASGGGSNVMRNTGLVTSYQAILSTQATGGGAHLSHVGTFRVYLRAYVPTTNTGVVTLAWEWGEGDYLRATLQNETQIPAESGNTWLLLDMGLVSPQAVAAGTQKWEGRVVAKSTVAGDDVDVDYLMFVPADEGSGIASAVTRASIPTSYVARDDFTSTTAGNDLNARAAPVGGTWATSGDATDLQFSDAFGEHLVRSTTSDTDGRRAVVGSTDYTNMEVEVRVRFSANPAAGTKLEMGAIARWVDASNFIRAVAVKERDGAGDSLQRLELWQEVAGTETLLGSTSLALGLFVSASWFRVRVAALSSGFATARLLTDAGVELARVEALASVLATGGTLEDGKPGIYDRSTSSSAVSRNFDDLFVWVPPSDAAVFGGQSLEVRHDRVQREDAAGGIWSTVSSYLGDYLLVPPSGAESRTLRVIVKGARSNEADSSIDDLSARLFVTPRYLAPPA